MDNDALALAELFAGNPIDGPEDAVGFVLWRVVHRYQRVMDRALAPFDLTHLQFMLLVLAAWMGRAGEAATQVQVGRFGDIQPMQVSHMLKTLERKGFVVRPRSPADVRAKRIAITPAGIAVLRDSLPVAIAVQSRVFGADGGPGGDLLTALLRVDQQSAEVAS